MPAHVEYQLLSKIIETGDMRTVLDEGITEDFSELLKRDLCSPTCTTISAIPKPEA
jgi:hypothetical protein